MTPCMAISGLLLALCCLTAAKARSQGITKQEDKTASLMLGLAVVVMLFGIATGN